MTEKKSKSQIILFFEDLLDIVETIFIMIFVIALIFTFFLKNATVQGCSMQDTLQDKDKILIYDFLYSPKQGDVIVFNNKYGYVYDENKINIIQNPGLASIAASPQDELVYKRLVKRIIAVEGQKVYIDFAKGKVFVDDVEIDESYIKNPTFTDENAFDYPIIVPDGFVFVMGDNRGNSTDSRDQHVGFVPVDEIVGKVIFRIYPLDTFGLIE